MDGTPRTAADLIRLTESGASLEYTFFWGHRPQPDGAIGAGCLSQWWPTAFMAHNVTFRSSEHYMMYRKAILFGDEEAAGRILAASHPRQAKMLGRRVRNFEEEIWVKHRYQIVVDASLAKFGQDRDLMAFLRGTGDRVLVEASPTDRIWGIGLTGRDERAADPAQWRGLNLLGFALMQARAELR
ncbi:MAG TPA: NADAR family protein [Actinoplanes sp.]|nr:NADAR family protein [Actinoplanes sp.]